VHFLPDYIELESLRYEEKTHYFKIKSKVEGTGFFIKGLTKALSKLQEIKEFRGLMVSVMPQSHPTKEKLWIRTKNKTKTYKSKGFFRDLVALWNDYSIFITSLYKIHKK